MSILAEKKERFHFLDGLRGIAATMVVLLHSTGGSFAQLTKKLHVPLLGSAYENLMQSGVVLFFVLSGVVLLRPYLRSERPFRSGNYFLRRFKRLYPPYFFALIFASLVVYFNTCFPTWYNEKGLRVVFTWSEAFKEFFIIKFDGIFYNLAWWSLGIEVVFYLLAPVLVRVFPKKGKISNMQIGSILCATFALMTIVQVFLSRYYPSIYSIDHIVPSVYRFIDYPLCFLLGMFLATKDFGRSYARIFIFSGIILLAGAMWYLPFSHSGFGFIYAAIIILSFNAGSFRYFLSKPVMVWLGERSYSFFLIHFSVFYFVDNIVSHFLPARNIAYFLLTRGIGLPLSLFAAMLLFTFVEKRFAHGLVTADAFWPWQVKPIEK